MLISVSRFLDSAKMAKYRVMAKPFGANTRLDDQQVPWRLCKGKREKIGQCVFNPAYTLHSQMKNKICDDGA